MVLIGRVVRPHGVRGEIKVLPETDDPARVQALGGLWLGARPDRAVRREVESVRAQPTSRGLMLIFRLRGVDTREAAEALQKQSVYCPESDLPPLEADEFFLHDLIGLPVLSEDGTPLGTLVRVLELPAHPVYVVRLEDGREAMAPAVPEIVVEVQPGSRIVIRPLEGLLD